LAFKSEPCTQKSQISFALFVSSVLPAEPAVLAHLEAFGRLLLVLGRAVIAPLTFEARERDDVSHDYLLGIGNLLIG
jgi:hypothetical protein